MVKTLARRSRTLVAIKLVHTLVWAFLAGSILALPIMAWEGNFRVAAVLSVLITLEIGVLAVNRGRCPLTDLASRFTEDRSPDFDIYLPVWLARHNKEVFGTIFFVNELIVLAMWWRTK